MWISSNSCQFSRKIYSDMTKKANSENNPTSKILWNVSHFADMVLANRMRFTQSLCVCWLLWICLSWSQFSTLGPLRKPLLCCYTFMVASHFRWDCISKPLNFFFFLLSLLNMWCYVYTFQYIYSKSCFYHCSHVWLSLRVFRKAVPEKLMC